MSSLARVRNSGSLFQSNICDFVFAWDLQLAAVRVEQTRNPGGDF